MVVYPGARARQIAGPAIVLMHHRGGIDNFTTYVAGRLSARGYVVAIPDLYQHCPETVPMSERKALLRDSKIVEHTTLSAPVSTSFSRSSKVTE